MNKILIGISILLGSVLIVENMVLWNQAQIIIWYSNAGNLVFFSIFLWTMLWFWIKWLINEKNNNFENNDEWVKF
jgi:hypothetical protein